MPDLSNDEGYLGTGIVIRCKLNMRVVSVGRGISGDVKLKTHDHYRWRRFAGFIDFESLLDKSKMPRRKVLAFSYSTPEKEWVDVSDRLGEYLVGVEVNGEIFVVLRGGEPIIVSPNCDGR